MHESIHGKQYLFKLRRMSFKDKKLSFTHEYLFL